MRLNGRVALVSGSLRGIGRAAAECLVEEGAQLFLTDLEEENSPLVLDACASLPGARYLRLDAASEEQWRMAVLQVEQEFGRLDILVNNVGTDMTGKVQDITFADWQRLIHINLDTVFLGTRSFQPLLATSGALTPYGSSIINISSLLGLVGMADTSAYSASKGGIRLFSKAVAIEFAEAGVPIRVNSVHPGFVDTPMLQKGMTDLGARSSRSADEMKQEIAQAVPIGRMAGPHEIGKVVAFLASDDASYMTGSEVVVDGGWSAR